MAASPFSWRQAAAQLAVGAGLAAVCWRSAGLAPHTAPPPPPPQVPEPPALEALEAQLAAEPTTGSFWGLATRTTGTRNGD